MEFVVALFDNLITYKKLNVNKMYDDFIFLYVIGSHVGILEREIIQAQDYLLDQKESL